MSRKKFITIICYSIVTLILSACTSTVSDTSDYDVTRFFVQTVGNVMSNENIVCYEEASGEIIEVINVGMEEQPLIIVERRIFYVSDLQLVSVDFEGKDRIVHQKNDDDITFTKITSADGEWLYCDGYKRVEIYGDPVALDGDHSVRAKYRVKVDFSEYSEM